MADALYRRLRVYARAGDLFGGMFAKPHGRGGARTNAGGYRPGSGRKKLIGPKLSEGKPLASVERPAPKKPHYPKRACNHEKPVFANGKSRKHCFDCYPKPVPRKRKPYEFRAISIETCAAPRCGAEFIKNMHHGRYCSSKCRTKVGNSRKDSDLYLGSRFDRFEVRRDRFDPLAVLDRDGWRCRFCLIDTPKTARGTYKHNAPEVDHIVPISRGGEHSMANTQCLCRACNQSKGRKTMTEFLGWLAA